MCIRDRSTGRAPTSRKMAQPLKPVAEILLAIDGGGNNKSVKIEDFNAFMQQVAKLQPLDKDTDNFVGNFSPQHKKEIPVTELRELLGAMGMIDRERFLVMHKTAVALNIHRRESA
eukprot:TRINITY_DN29352_c0_g1_i2.p2 TRINITY_DN29352_c0_g1~~TRINITY_DN29352_c0_g1_i2.p2  ORF type:complete len:116 (+),score=42.04 TRINITY_DN29352_c0_g1_i2:78-425(+)